MCDFERNKQRKGWTSLVFLKGDRSSSESERIEGGRGHERGEGFETKMSKEHIF